MCAPLVMGDGHSGLTVGDAVETDTCSAGDGGLMALFVLRSGWPLFEHGKSSADDER